MPWAETRRQHRSGGRVAAGGDPIPDASHTVIPFSAHATTPSRRRNPPVGGRLGPICRASTRAQDRCLLPSPGLTFHIGRPEGSSSSPQPHPSAGGSAAVPLCLASAILRGAVVHVVHAARGPASNSTVPARGMALRGGPGIAAAFRRAQPDGPPLTPSAVSTAPTRSPARESASARMGEWGLLPIWLRAGRRFLGLVGVLPHRWVLEGRF